MTSLQRPVAGTATTTPSPVRGAARATRCECQRCGVHTFPVLRPTVVPYCHNCGSTELEPVDPRPAPAGREPLSYARTDATPRSAA